MSRGRFNSRRRGGFDQFMMNGEFLRVSDETCNKLKHIPCTAEAEETPAIAIDWEAKKREDEEHSRKLYEGLPPVKRDFYIEDPEVARLSKEEVAKIRFENRQISVSFREAEECLDAPNPVTTFRQAWQHFPDILELLEGRYEKPSPIQMQLWPVLLRGRDAIGIAQTGTGKTLAFLLPGLVNIQNQDPETKVFTGPRMIVIAPTRELALQIDDEVNKLQYSKIKSVCVYGQGDRGTQLRKLADGAMVVVATPGRLADLLRSQEVDLRRVSYVVFDEADRMLDMGFLCHLSLILNSVRKDRQFVMTSATWNSDIHHIAKFYLTDEIMVRVGERELKATYTVTQDVIVCEEDEKNAKLLEFLDTRTPDDKGLVFVNRRLSCEPLFSTIFEHFASKKRPLLWEPTTLYGTMHQEAREQSLDMFRRSESRLLICTDVAARGLDVIDVTYVINYDLPRNLEEYVHRAGRTGRAGRSGYALTFVTWSDRQLIRPFMDILNRSNAPVPSELVRMADRADRAKARRDNEGGGRDRRGGGFAGDRNRGRENSSSRGAFSGSSYRNETRGTSYQSGSSYDEYKSATLHCPIKKRNDYSSQSNAWFDNHQETPNSDAMSINKHQTSSCAEITSEKTMTSSDWIEDSSAPTSSFPVMHDNYSDLKAQGQFRSNRPKFQDSHRRVQNRGNKSPAAPGCMAALSNQMSGVKIGQENEEIWGE